MNVCGSGMRGEFLKCDDRIFDNFHKVTKFREKSPHPKHI